MIGYAILGIVLYVQTTWSLDTFIIYFMYFILNLRRFSFICSIERKFSSDRVMDAYFK
jgi:hypothetical protein